MKCQPSQVWREFDHEDHSLSLLLGKPGNTGGNSPWDLFCLFRKRALQDAVFVPLLTPPPPPHIPPFQMVALVEASASVLEHTGHTRRVCAVRTTKTTEPGSLQNEQITRNLKNKFKSNENLDIPICEVGSLKVSAFSELSVYPKEEFILEME